MIDDANPTCTIYLARHGQAEFNRDQRILGQIESPLTEQGIHEAELLREKLGTVKFAAVYTSSLQRTIDTARIITGARPAPFLVEDRLKERGFGPLEGKPEHQWQEIQASQSDHLVTLTQAQQWEYKFAPYIESNAEIFNRAEPALRSIANTHLGQTILVVAHAGSIRMLLIGLGLQTQATLPEGSFKTGIYAVLHFDGEHFRLTQIAAASPRQGED